MAKNETRLLSGRIKTKSGNTLDSRRTTFLSLDNAEPNFGNPDSDRYILASLANGERLFLKLNKGFLVSADSVSGDESTFEIDPSGLANAAGTTLAEVLDNLDSAITEAFTSGAFTDDNFNGAGTVSDPLSLDSDLRIFGITGDSATFTNITRTGTNVTAGTYGSVTEIPVFTVDSSGFVDSIGEVSISTTLNTSGETGTGSVSLLDSALNIAAGEGINTVASGNTVTVSGEDASTTNKGVAHFDSSDFIVSSGYVSVRSSGVGNAQLENDTVTIGSTGIALGETSTTLSGLTQVNTTNLSVTDSATIFQANITTLDVTDSATIADATVTGVATINQATVTTLDVSDSATISDLTVDSDANLTHVYVSDLTDNRVVIAGASGRLEDDANFTFNGTQFDIGGGNFTVQQVSGNTQIVGTLDVDQQTTLASANVQDLTNDRLVVAGTNGELEDDANLTYNGSTLTVANSTTSTNSANGALVVTGGVGIGGALNVNGNTEIAGDLTVTGTTTTIEVQTLAIHDPLIHLADSNESGDEVDIGFVGHYYDAALGGRQHTGLFRDATDDKYYLFAQYQDSALDSSPRSNVIDRSDPSFVLADFNAATIFADTFSGTVSADSITTTNLTTTGIVNFAGATVSDGGTVITVDIDGGTIDGTDITVGAGKTLNVSAGTLTLANDQISGDKVEGGTIDTVTVNNLTSGNVDINGGNIDGTTIDTSDITVGTGKTLDVSAGTLTLADDQISGDKVEGGTINAVTINNLTSGNVNIDGGFIDGTTIGHTTPDSGTFTNLARTSPSGVTAGVYGSVTEIPVVTVDASGFIDSIGEVAISTTLNTSAETGTGTVNLLDSSLEIAAGEGINTTASGNTITIAGEDASTSNKGVASFDAGDFSVSSGAVSIKTAGVGNDQLEFDSVTVTAGSGLTGGGTIALGSSAELKLDSAVVKGLFSGGANINYNNSTGEIAVAASGVVAGTYGTFNKIPIISVDSFGQVDSIGLVTAATSLGDTVDSMSFNSLTGVITLTTDVATFPVQLGLAPFDTDSLAEGLTNLYYTTARVDSDILSKVDSDYVRARADSDYIKSVTGINADTLDTLNSTSFLRSDDDTIKTAGYLRLNDNLKLTFGTSFNDLEIFNDGSNSFISEVGTGDLYITTNGQEVLIKDSENGKLSAEFIPSAEVDLYYNGSKKLNTSNTGVTITGIMAADSGTLSGNRILTTADFGPGGGINADFLDGVSSEQFLRSDQDDSMAGTLFIDDSLSANNITRRNTTVTAGTYGSGSAIPVVTVDASGFVDSIGSVTVATVLNTSAETGTGTVNLLDSSLEIASGVGIDTVASGNTVTVEIDSADLYAYFNHDSFSGFVADEHIAHSSININAGKGLTGGGNIASDVTIDIDSANVRAMFSGGDGLTYNNGTGEFTVVGGDGITVGADSVGVTVDNSTIELSATDGSGAVRVKDGGITNAKLQYDSSTIGTTSIVLGGSTTTLAGLTQVDIDNIRIDGNTISSTAGSYMYIDPYPTDSAGTLVILGNLQVDGETTTIQSSTVTISDKNIVLADSATTNAQANGSGITVNGSNATITYDGVSDRWDFNKDIEVANIYANLTATTVDINGGFIDGVNIGSTTADSATFTGITVNNNIIVSGTVDGRDIATDGSKLDGIEEGATADQTAQEIMSLIQTLDSNNSGLNAATLDGQEGSYYLDAANLTGSIELTSGTILSELVVDDMTINTDSAELSGTPTSTEIATFSATTYSGAKLVVTAKDGSNRYISELLITHNGTTAVSTEYGQVATSTALATYDVDINAGNVRLLATPASSNTTVFKVMKLLLID